MRKRGSDLRLVSLVLSLVNIDKCTYLNSEPEKCCPTKRTIGSLLPKINTKKPRHPPWLMSAKNYIIIENGCLALLAPPVASMFFDFLSVFNMLSIKDKIRLHFT